MHYAACFIDGGKGEFQQAECHRYSDRLRDGMLGLMKKEMGY